MLDVRYSQSWQVLFGELHNELLLELRLWFWSFPEAWIQLKPAWLSTEQLIQFSSVKEF